MKVVSKANLWGALWRSENRIDGRRRHLIHRACKPVMFRTKRETQAWIRHEYGEIATRKDLRVEPFGWRMPQPVRIRVETET